MAPTSAARLRPRRADVREQLVRAATRAFAERGYAEVSVHEIASAAGFTKGAVYSNFGGKPELFAAACAEQFGELIGQALAGALRAVETDDRAPAAAIAASLTAYVTEVERWPTLLAEFRALVTRDPGLRQVYADLRRRQLVQLVDLLHGLRRITLAPDLDVPMAATLLLTCVSSLALEHAAAPEAVPAAQIEALLAHVVGGILA